MSMAQLSVVFGLPHIAVVKWTIFQRACRLVVRFGTRGFMSWMVVWSLCLLGFLVGFPLGGVGLVVGVLGLVVCGGGGVVGVVCGVGVGGVWGEGGVRAV